MKKMTFPMVIKLGYAGDTDQELQNRVNEAFHIEIREKILEACNGNLLVQYYRQLVTNPLKEDGSQENVTVTLVLFGDISVGSIIERRTEGNYFEFSYSIYSGMFAIIADKYKKRLYSDT